MRTQKSIIWLLCFLVFATAFTYAKRPDNKLSHVKYEPGVVVIKLKASSSSLGKIDQAAVFSQLQSQHGVRNPERVFQINPVKKKKGEDELERIFTLAVDVPTDIPALAKQLSEDPHIEFAEPNYYFPVNTIPNDPLYSQIYPLSIVKADSAWSIQKGDSSVVIGIIDTGVDWDHPDLASSIWTNTKEIPGNNIDDDGNGYVDDIRGWDFVANVSDAYSGEDGSVEDNNPMDFDGHGTHVAGIAAGTTNNGVGIASLGWGCKIMPLRCGWHSSDGNGYVSSLYASKAYKYAADNGASVCNQSSGTSEVVLEAARYAYQNGVVIINSAGNSNSEDLGLLGTEAWALSVAATNSNDNKASYSSYGSKVDISAPGGDFSSGNRAGFLSTVVYPSSFYSNQQYVSFQGTSMSSPFVAALAGLIKSKNKTWTPAQIMFQITGTADNIDSKNPSYIGKLGAGRINALRAVTETPAEPAPKLEFISYTIDDAVGGNGNGILEAGENVKFNIVVLNTWGDAKNLTATLSTSYWGITMIKGSSNYGLLRGISNIDSMQRGSIGDEFTFSVDPTSPPKMVPFTVTFTADGGYTKQFQFEIPISPQFLVVDDDDGLVNVEGYYTSALKSLGTTYEVWNHAAYGTPPLALLQKYSAVIWLCEWAFPSLDAKDRGILSSYLSDGGHLFLSGQDIGWDLADPEGIENVTSSGASKTFFETYLKASYIADDAGVTGLKGVSGDTIGDGIQFNRFQPNRASSEQYPDVIAAKNGSVVSFQYTSGTHINEGGAVLYSGEYKLVYFAFGGFESIVEPEARISIMNRILNWFSGSSVVVDILKDNENTTNTYPVQATVTSTNAVQSVDLYWSNNDEASYTKVGMSSGGNGKYSGSIPAQSSNTNITYFVVVKTSNGFLPYSTHQFHVGPDTTKPVVTILDSLKNTITLTQSSDLVVLAKDNIDIDSTSVTVHYAINEGPEQVTNLQKYSTDSYKGKIVPVSPFTSGSIVKYYVTASDISQAKNLGRYPVDGYKQFVVGREIVDDFEDPLSGKWELGLWDYTTKIKRSGIYSITDSPDSNYKPNTERTLRLKQGFNLEPFTSALLTYYRRFNIDASDTLYVEVSSDGSSWTTLKKLNGLTLWQQDKISLNNFVGSGNSNVTFRFRFKTDPVDESKDGVYIDDMEILTDNFTISGLQYNAHVPLAFSLRQNYPNPFNPVTTIQFDIATEVYTTLVVYDVIGREVANLVREVKTPGTYQIQFSASQLSSGIYYYRLTAGDFSRVKKMVVIK